MLVLFPSKYPKFVILLIKKYRSLQFNNIMPAPTKLKLTALVLLLFILTSGTIDLDDLFDYENQEVPAYIGPELDRQPVDNQVDNKIATLGRVLFYDKKLSSDNSVSCASCHDQNRAFGLTELQGTGVNGLSRRRPMRLVNLRYKKFTELFFWDERTETLEELATQPIKDHVEMGYSGVNGAPVFSDLIGDLEDLAYYNSLFTFAYGDNAITEDRIGRALAQFMRSIQSFDARFDAGYEAVGADDDGANLTVDFPNFTSEENRGKLLFFTDPNLFETERIDGGVGCFHCHGGPGFHFLPEGQNNGVITEIEGDEVLTITKSPSLRDIFGPDGSLNGPLFHNGQAETFDEVVDHYDMLIPNIHSDGRLEILGSNLHLSPTERADLEAFVKTLTGVNIYTDEKYSDPFDADGNIEVIGGTVNIRPAFGTQRVVLFPNPAQNFIKFEGLNAEIYDAEIYDVNGRLVLTAEIFGKTATDVSGLEKGVYSVRIAEKGGEGFVLRKFVKN